MVSDKVCGADLTTSSAQDLGVLSLKIRLNMKVGETLDITASVQRLVKLLIEAPIEPTIERHQYR